MTPLPVISSDECIKALKKAGFVFDRQKGSHIRLVNEETKRYITVAEAKEMKRGTLSAVISGAGLTIDEFVDLLGKKQKGKKK